MRAMAHNVKMSGNGVKFCTKCGEQVFGAVCAGEVAQMQLSAAQERMRMATHLVIALITLSVTVYFFHGAVAWGDETTDKLVASMNAGFGKAQEGLKTIAAALGVGNLALLGPGTFLGAGLDKLVSAIHSLRRALARGA